MERYGIDDSKFFIWCFFRNPAHGGFFIALIKLEYMESNLTVHEQEFYSCLKKKLFLTKIAIRTKVPLAELCDERKDLVFNFGGDKEIINDIVIDFVLYKDSKPVAGIEVFDEPEELENRKGENMLKELLFTRMGYEYFKVVDLNNMNEAARIVKEKTVEHIRAIER